VPNSYSLHKKLRKKRYKKLKNKGFLFAFVMILLFFLLVINLSDVFSSLITNSGSVFSSQKIEIPSYNIYAVSVYDFDNEFQANSIAKKVAKEGGAGYVYHSGEYFVIAASYPVLAYAQEVQNNLQSLGYNARIVNINIDKVSKNYKGKNLKLFNASLTVFRSCYDELYDNLIKFDKEQISKQQINSTIAKYLSQISSLKNSLKQLKKEEDVSLSNIVLDSIENLEAKLSNLLYSSKNKEEFSSQVKVTLIDIVLLNKQVCINFN
jgi:hypothetical protein